MTQPPAPALLLQDITCTFVSRDDPNARYTAVANTTLKVAPGEFVSVVGPTGCGKSTAHAIDVAAQNARQKAAEEIVQQDPFVQVLVKDFGAQVIPGSVHPGPTLQ